MLIILFTLLSTVPLIGALDLDRQKRDANEAVLTTSSDVADSGDTVTLTCTHGSIESGSITVVWKLWNTVLSSGITSNGDNTASLYTVGSVSSADNGDYTCTVTFGELGTVTSSALTQYVRDETPDATVEVVVDAATVTLSCVFYGDTVTTTAGWFIDDAGSKMEPADASKYVIFGGSYGNQLITTTLTIKAIETSDAADYTCKGAYTDGPVDVQSVQTLEVLTAVLTTSSDVADSGDAVTLTCTHGTIESGSITVVWKLWNTVLSSGITSNGDNTASLYTVGSVSSEDNGDYTCTVTFGELGTITSSALTQYVRDATPDATVNSEIGSASITLTCVFYGDTVTTTAGWFIDDAVSKMEPADASKYVVVGGSYADHQITTTLTIKEVSTPDALDYTCKGAYTDGPVDVQSVQTLDVLTGVSMTTTSTTVTEGNDVVFTCEFSNPSTLDVTPSITWSKDDEAVSETPDTTNANNNPVSYETLTITSVGKTDSAVYNCEVDYGKYSLSLKPSDSITLVVEGTDAMADQYKVDRDDAVLVCSFYGGDGEVTWSMDSNDIDPSKYNTDAYDEETDTLESTLTLTRVAASDGGEYHCDVTFTASGNELAILATIYVLEIETDPDETLVRYGEGYTATMSCTTDDTAYTISQFVWSDDDIDNVYMDTSFETASGSRAGFNKYTSKLEINGAAENNDKQYRCTAHTTSPAVKEEASRDASFYVVGVQSSTVDGYAGSYIESDKIVGEYSEDYTITVQIIYEDMDIISVSSTFTNIAGTETDVTFDRGDHNEDNYRRAYTYVPIENLKETGVYTFSIEYEDFPDIRIHYEKRVYVFEFCLVSDLPTIAGGLWSPEDKVEYKSYATFTCTSGYFAVGSSTAHCSTSDGNFEYEVQPSCEPLADLTCGSLTSTSNGFVTYLSGTQAQYGCDNGYTLLGGEVVYTCSSLTGKWSMETQYNYNENAPVCQETAASESRTTSVSITFSTESALCTTVQEEDSFKTQLTTFLLNNGLVSCLEHLQCEMVDFTCTYTAESSEIVVTFDLDQLFDLSDVDVLSNDADFISAKVDAGELVVNIIAVVSRKRSAEERRLIRRTTVTVTATGVTATTATSCPADTVSQSGSCVECPAGYGLSGGICVICPIGEYATTAGVEACTACEAGETTKTAGSDEEAACEAEPGLCTIKEGSANGAFSPPAGSIVEPSDMVTIFCEDGYSVSFGTADNFRCDLTHYPICHRTCSMVLYNEDVLAERNIYNNIEALMLVYQEGISISCLLGYEWSKDVSVKYFSCNDSGNTIDLGLCHRVNDPVVLTVLIVCASVFGVAVLLLFLFIVLQWREKMIAARRKQKKTPYTLMNIEAVRRDVKPLKLHAPQDSNAPIMSRPVHISDFEKYYSLLTCNQDEELNKEFKTFEYFDENSTCVEGSRPENETKNRYKNVIPFDYSRVKLSILGDDPYSDYVNATYIHGYHKPRAFIAAQGPLYETINDFWRMIWQEKTTIVINMTKTSEVGKGVVYWPVEGDKRYGDVSVTSSNKTESNAFDVLTFKLRHNGETARRTLYLFNYVGWPDYDVPRDTAEFLNFIYDIRHTLLVVKPIGPIICQCSAGTGRSGSFIALMNCLDRLLVKHDVDILGVVGSLRQQRRRMVFTDNQYKFIHRVLLDVISNSNFIDMKQSGFRTRLEHLESQSSTTSQDANDTSF